MAVVKMKSGGNPAPKQKEATSKVQAGAKAPAKDKVIANLGAEVTHAHKVLSACIKADGVSIDSFDADELKQIQEHAISFIKAESRDFRSFDELMAWADSPFTAHGRKSLARGTPWAKFLAKNPINAQPVAKGRVREAMRITSPGPRLDIQTSSKLRTPKDGETTIPDRTEKCEPDAVHPQGVRRMADKKPSKPAREGKFGLTIPQAQSLLKTAPGTGSRGYSEKVTALCKSLFDGRTVSTLKAAEINTLVKEAKAQGILSK